MADHEAPPAAAGANDVALGQTPRDQVNAIIDEIAARYGVTREQITMPRNVDGARTPRFVIARHHAIVAVGEAFPEISTPHLGVIFGGRDHTTILAARAAHAARVAKGETK